MPQVSRPVAVLMLLICTALWGFAFVAQKNAMAGMGPMTFFGARYLLGGVLILPLAMWEYRQVGRPLDSKGIRLAAVLTVALFFGSLFQQFGLMSTTVTNGGFLTGLYVLFVPVLALVATRARPHPVLAVCAPLAMLGLFLLNGGRFSGLNSGDVLVIISALFWAVHVFLLGSASRYTGLPITLSAITFIVAGGLGSLGALAIEAPTLETIASGWREILYVGALSTAVAFTFQAIGQQYVPPANAAVILSSESLFAALGGALLLGERLPVIGYVGAAMMFTAIVLVETVPALGNARATGRAATRAA